ncbi:DDB1- and CUL4-associated factor 15 isoform X1 [Stigmatopora argus]
MAPSAKSGQNDSKHKTQRRYKDHIVKLLVRGKLSGHFPQHLFRKLAPRVCVPLKNIVNEEFLRAGHIFLGFTKCGRYILSYTRDCGEDDDFSFYTYHLYWWEFNLHSRLKQVQHVRLFAGEEIYNDLYLTVCGWPYDQSKIVIFGFNRLKSCLHTRCNPFSSLLMNLMSAENYRDIYITIASMPSPHSCHACCPQASTPSASNGSGGCLEHGYVLNSRYQVVYPFPTFQPAFHLKKDQVILLNTSYSLVACGISLCRGKEGKSSQILYTKRASLSHRTSASASPNTSAGSPERQSTQSKLVPTPLSPRQSQTVTRAREFAADLFRRAQGDAGGKEGPSKVTIVNDRQEPPNCPRMTQAEMQSCSTEKLTIGQSSTQSSEETPCLASSSMLPSPPPTPSTSQEPEQSEPGYVNYSCLHYCLQSGLLEQNEGGHAGYEDDKVQLAFTVTDLKGRSLQLVSDPHDGQQSVRVEQLTLDFEYLINEVIRRDAAWASQFCSFSDYDVVILEVCPDTNTVIISIGLLLLAFSPSEHCRPNTYHSNLQVSWDLNTGVCCTVGVGDLTEVKGQTSGRVWSSYRKSCVNTLMKWLIPESSSRYINRLTNEGLHKGTSLQVLADSDRCTWIVL